MIYLQKTERKGDLILAFSKEIAPCTLSEREGLILAGVREEDECFEEDLKIVLRKFFSTSAGGESVTVDLDTLSDKSARSYYCNAVLEALKELEELPVRDIYLLSRRDFEAPQEVEDAVARPEKENENTSFSEAGDSLRAEINEYLKEEPAPSFRQYLSALIDEKGIAKDSTVYRAAGISKFTFSKIMNHRLNYKPSKPTVAALAIGLKLTTKEAQELFHAAGFHLGKSDITDRIVRFYLEKQIFDLGEVNDCLYYYGIPLLGERMRQEVRVSD